MPVTIVDVLHLHLLQQLSNIKFKKKIIPAVVKDVPKNVCFTINIYIYINIICKEEEQQ